jgi:hypothetical protein
VHTGSFGPPTLLTVTAAALAAMGFGPAALHASDLFAGKGMGVFSGTCSVPVPTSGAKMVKITAATGSVCASMSKAHSCLDSKPAQACVRAQ